MTGSTSAVMSDELDDLLREVSRSFHRTLRVLPRAIRPQISLAYLLARATDTIADTTLVPLDRRIHALDRLRDSILHPDCSPPDLSPFLSSAPVSVGTDSEQRLLRQLGRVLDELRRLNPSDQQHITDVLQIITGGQRLDLERFGAADAAHLVALEDDTELDDYTWRVAGCVGEFWTRMCRAHLLSEARWQTEEFAHNGIRFGKGLQLVNILRDLPQDLRQGRCYLPRNRLNEAHLTPTDLLNASVYPRFQPLYESYLNRAAEHLAAGWSYTNALPWNQARLRLACAWPILIGLETLQQLRCHNILDASVRLKISRREVGHIIRRTLLRYPWPGWWARLFTDAFIIG